AKGTPPPNPARAIRSDQWRALRERRMHIRVLLRLGDVPDGLFLEHLGRQRTEATVRVLAADARVLHEAPGVGHPVVHRDWPALEGNLRPRTHASVGFAPIDVIIARPHDGEATFGRHVPDVLRG